jgi:ubiquinone/menaquinone biosynthesis C-methylase UbiE
MTLPRVLEPEVMDSWQEATDYDAMDHAEANRNFVTDLLATGAVEGFVLDLGTGTAQIPVELCRRCDDCCVMASDLATNMLDVARYNIEIAGLITRIQLDHADAKQTPYPDNRFDVVMCNGMLHHLAEPRLVLAEAVRVTAPGGRIFFRDLLRPETEEQLQRLVQTYAGAENERQRQMFENSLRAALTLAEIRGLVGQLGFGPDTVQATSDRHWTWQVRRTAAQPNAESQAIPRE